MTQINLENFSQIPTIYLTDLIEQKHEYNFNKYYGINNSEKPEKNYILYQDCTIYDFYNFILEVFQNNPSSDNSS